MDAKQIADHLNRTGKTYYGERARAWEGATESRIYFGRDYVRLLPGGEISNAVAGKARSLTIGESGLALVRDAVEVLR